MNQLSAAQQQEIQQLKARVAKHRSSGRRAVYPQGIKDRVRALRAGGVPAQTLATALDVAGSQIYAWAGPTATQSPPTVLQVASRADEGRQAWAVEPQELQLSFGRLRVTINVAGV